MGASSLDAQAASGPLERARKNVSALRVLRELEESGRAPSADEVAALGAYSGWGGAQEAFSDRPDTGPWRTLRASLEDVLKEEDYAAARASTLTAFYTPGPVIEAMWEALRDVGVGRLSHATVLEPGCGTGNFMRSVPGGMDVSVVGVEVDPTSARIASALARPGNQVVNAALEDCAIPDGSFDAVIGNVPYSDSIRVEDRGRAVPIHDYFVSRALDAVRPGGVVALLTSRYTLDKASSATREELAKRAELVGVARLPEETFEAQAGTSVISDVLFLRRRARALDEVPSEAREWLETGSLGESDGSGPRVSRALLDHPERVIGELSVGSGPFGPTLAVHAPGVTGGPLKDALARALARQLGPRAQEIRASLPKRLAAPVVAVRPRKVDAFELTLADDGGIWYGSGDEVVPFEPRSAGDLPRVRAMLCLRDESRALLSAEADPSFSDDEVEGRIGALDRHYDEFVARYGHLADAANRRALRQNVFQDATVATTLLSLEDTRQGRFSSKASMLERRVITPAPPMPERAESASDAVAISIDQTGGLDTPLVARLLGVSEDALDDALGDLSVRDPDSGALMLAAEYLSGDVVGKLEHVRALIRREEDGGREAREASWRRTLALPDHLSADRDLMERVSAAVRSLRESGLYQTALQPLSSPTVTLTDRFSEPSIAHALGTYDSDQRRYALDRVLSDAERGKDGGLAGFEVIRNLLDGALDGRYDTVWSPGKDTPSRPSWALWRTLSAVSQNRDQLSSLVDGVLARHRRPRPCVVALHAALGMESVSVELRRTGGRGDSSALVEALLAHPHVTEYVYLLEGEGRLRDASPEGLASFECRRADAVGGVTIDQGRMSFLQTLKDRLEAACPRRIGHEDIAAQLGSAWIPPVVVLRFMRDLFKINVTSMTESELKRWSVTHDTVTGRWQVTGSSSALLGPVAREFGIEQYPCHKLVESLLNGSQLRCTKPDPDDFNKRVADPVATARAWEKRSKIEQAFRDWVWKDPAQARMLEDVYNRRFNRTVNRRYDGSALTFPGMAEGIRLRSHQADAVARVLESEEGTLLGHVVGAGKTFEAVAAMHEARRLGRATKPMAVVPNHLTGQFASEWLRMYPDAKLLVMDDSDTRSPEAAQRFWGRARAGEWDAVIVGHSRFSKLALSPEIQERATQARLDELKDSIEAGRKSEGRQSFTVKAQEGLRKRLERQLRDLQARKGADELGISFDELGVDMLVVDESHFFKNLAIAGSQVAGMSVQGSGKCEDLLYKCDWLRQQGKGRNIVFMTGTPVTNTMGELYNLQRYLAPDSLRTTGTSNFTDWALTYGHLEETMEVRPEGGGFQSRMRFTKFQNLPELMVAYHGFADIVTQDMVDLDLPELAKRSIVVDAAPEQQRAMDLLVERAKRIRAGAVDQKRDNMLKITGDGRKLALDPMLVRELGATAPLEGGKVQACAERVHALWRQGEAARTTQLVFCDSSTDVADGFNVYDDLRRRLHDLGIPDDQVASVGDVGDNKAKRERLFERVDSGEVRVLIGSTEKLGTGTNVQHHLVAIHDLDCPWRPSDLEQRLGRIVRQGNENGLVYDFRYVTKGTFDAYMYQTVERKQRFIAQTFTSATPARTVDDLDPVQLDYAEVKALATGDPNVAARLSLENEVRQLELSRRAFEQGRSEVKDAIVSRLEPKASLLRERHDLLAAHQDAFAQALASEPPTREAAQLAAQALLSAPSGPTRSVIGDYRGLQVVAELRPGLLAEDPPIRYVGLMPKEEADLYRAHMARSPMPLSAEGPHTVLHQLNSIIEADARGGELVRDDLERVEADLADAERMAEEPWAQEVEWREKRGRLEALMHVDRVGTEEAPSAEEVRASVRAARLGKDDPSPVRRPDPNSRTW